MKSSGNVNVMLIILLTIFLFSFQFLYSQDIIIKKDGEKIEAKVTLIDIEQIQFNKYNNLKGPSYVINKSELIQIIFENGTIENFKEKSKSEKLSFEETKELIIKTINEHGFEEDNFKRRCRASFEGDFLRLVIMNRKGNKKVNDGLLYDFTRVINFHNVSDRGDKAFVNIWVMRQTNEEKDLWKKHKMVMRVDEIEAAKIILNSLKNYSSLLLDKRKK